MWIFWMLIGFAVLLWAGYAWIYALTHKYQHTAESYLMLSAIAALSLILGWKTVITLAPGWSGVSAGVFVALAGFMYFIGLSFLLVSIWCSLLAREFDEKLANLEEEQDSLTRRLETLRWKMLSSGEGSPPASQRSSEAKDTWETKEDQISSLEEFIDNWQKGGGAARVRSLKIQEWKEELAGMDKDDILAEIQKQTETLRDEEDGLKKEMGEVRLALLRLENLVRFSGAEKTKRSGSSSEESFKVVKPSLDETRIRERLQEIHRETQMVGALKREFFRGRVRLSWRGRM